MNSCSQQLCQCKFPITYCTIQSITDANFLTVSECPRFAGFGRCFVGHASRVPASVASGQRRQPIRTARRAHGGQSEQQPTDEYARSQSAAEAAALYRAEAPDTEGRDRRRTADRQSALSGKMARLNCRHDRRLVLAEHCN